MSAGDSICHSFFFFFHCSQMSKGPEDLPQLTPLCFRLVSVIHPVFVQCGQLDNNIVNMLLSHLLCGQASWVLFIISSQELMSELVLFIIFSFSLKAKKVFISLKKKTHTIPKHRQYPSSSAVSHATVLCEWTRVLSACACESGYVWAAGVHVQYSVVRRGHTLQSCHFPL